ncbi:hypothetical protein Ac2012v2_002740 [Leucoagaricus gongylophorus]
MTGTILLDTQPSQEVERDELPELPAVQSEYNQSSDAKDQPRTPLPIFQLFLVLLIQFSEPVAASIIYPFVNQFVRDTGITRGDDRKTGYYAGVIESAFFFAEAATVFQWGWLSDRFGRRPILLLGPLGLTFAMLRFGYSTSFLSMVLSRCMQGIFNGNIGVSKTVMVELTDSTNIGDAFALLPLMWGGGITAGPVMGGVFSNPSIRWPDVFGKFALLKEHPYLLPCMVAGGIAFFTFVIGFLGLKETHPTRTGNSSRDTEHRQESEAENATFTDNLLGHHDAPDYGTTSTLTHCRSPSPSEDSADSHRTLSNSNTDSVTLRTVLKSKRVQLVIINYFFVCFTEMCYVVLLPLIYSTSIETGGLGLNPYQIGLTMGIWGFFNAIIQINVVGKVIRKYGGASVYKFAYLSYFMGFLTFPFSTRLARRNGSVGIGSCIVIGFQLFFIIFAYMSYASIQVVVVDVAPKHLIGSVNGIVQMAGCIMRTLAPTIASSLFSFSIREQILGGYLIYVVLYIIFLFGIYFSRALVNEGRSA